MKMKDSIKKYLSGSNDSFVKKNESESSSGSHSSSTVVESKDIQEEVKVLEKQDYSKPIGNNAQDQEAALFESIFSALATDEWVEEGLQSYTSPTYRLSEPKSGNHHWLVDYTTKMMTPVKPELDVVPLQDLDNDTFLCQIGDAHYIVTGSIIQHVGYN